MTTLEPGEVLLELEVPAADRSVYLKAMDRKKFSFPIVGVAAVRRGEITTVALVRCRTDPLAARGLARGRDSAPGERVQAADREGARVSRPRYHRSRMRLLASLAAVLLAVGLLAGCGGKKSATSTTTAAT